MLYKNSRIPLSLALAFSSSNETYIILLFQLFALVCVYTQTNKWIHRTIAQLLFNSTAVNDDCKSFIVVFFSYFFAYNWKQLIIFLHFLLHLISSINNNVCFIFFFFLLTISHCYNDIIWNVNTLVEYSVYLFK